MSLSRALIPYFGGFKFDLATYTGNSLTVTGRSIAVKPDGSRLLILNGRTVSFYDMSTPGDLSTASANGSLTLPFVRVSSDLTSMRVSNDGLTLFVLDTTNQIIAAFTLSSAWGGTETYLTEIDTVETLTGGPPEQFECLEFDFTADGTRIIGMGTETLSNGATTSQIFMHKDLSSAFDLTTAGSWSGREVAFPVANFDIEQFRVVNDGLNLIFADNDPDEVLNETFTTANDASSITPNIGLTGLDTVGDGGGIPLDMDYTSDGKRLYVMATSKVLEYRTIG